MPLWAILSDRARDELVGVERENQHALGLLRLDLLHEGLDLRRLVDRRGLEGQPGCPIPWPNCSTCRRLWAAKPSGSQNVPGHPSQYLPLGRRYTTRTSSGSEGEGAAWDSAAAVSAVGPVSPATMPAPAIVTSASRRVNSPPRSCRTQNWHMLSFLSINEEVTPRLTDAHPVEPNPKRRRAPGVEADRSGSSASPAARPCRSHCSLPASGTTR